MELREARERAKESREAGYKATVPRGYPPGCYFVQVWTRDRGTLHLKTAQEWLDYHQAYLRQESHSL